MISCLLAYCVPASLGAFPSYLSVRTGQAALLINLQDYRHAPLALAKRRLAWALLFWERNQSHSSLWDALQISKTGQEEEAGWSGGGLGDMKKKRGDFTAIYCWCLRKLMLKISCAVLTFFTAISLRNIFAERKSNCGPPEELWKTHKPAVAK